MEILNGTDIVPAAEAERDALEEIRKLAPVTADCMRELLENPKTPALVKVRIIEIILNRTYGRPEAKVKMTTAHQSVEAAQIRIEELFERAAAEEE